MKTLFYNYMRRYYGKKYRCSLEAKKEINGLKWAYIANLAVLVLIIIEILIFKFIGL